MHAGAEEGRGQALLAHGRCNALARREPGCTKCTEKLAERTGGHAPGVDGRPGHVRFLNGVEIEEGTVYNYSALEDMQRVQIRDTIRSHLEKEQALFRHGIKCLSLFFIDEVAKYRDVTGNGATVGYGKVFEEEYAAAVEDRLSHPTMDDFADPSYLEYLRRDTAHQVHDGYFSIDKKGHAVESKREKKAEAAEDIGINDDDARRGYDLILKDKERLLSLDEPVRFIFSHSALREGWDNPNIFQICTLKESGSETSKRQEVGRGLRLCVDQDGVRQDAQLLGADEVQRVNVLTVIASDSYETFVRDLQSDIRSTLRERPHKVEIDFFTGKTLEVDGEEVSFSASDSRAIYKYLIKSDFLDDADRPSDGFRAMVGEGKFQANAMHELPEGLGDEAHAKAIEALLRGVYDPHALDGMVQQAQEKVTENALVKENFGRIEFRELWDRISRKHSHTVSFDDAELERKAVARIDKDLAVSRLQYTMTAGAQRAEGRREELTSGKSFVAERSKTHDVDEVASPVEVAYDLVGEVASAAQITRASAARILSGIMPQVFSLYRVNPEEFIKCAGGLILSEKAAMVVEHVEYHETDRSYDTAIFTSRMPDNASKAYEASKNVQRFVFPDSQGERRFAEDLDAASEVVVYAKLPRSFQISTLVGSYEPDLAIAFRKGRVRHVSFVAETKDAMDTMEISGVEKAKIRCAERLFDEASTSDVR